MLTDLKLKKTNNAFSVVFCLFTFLKHYSIKATKGEIFKWP